MSGFRAVTVRMEPVEEEAVVSELKRQLEDVDLDPEQKVSLLNNGLNSETTISITPVCLSLYLPVCLPHTVRDTLVFPSVFLSLLRL